MPQHPKFVGDKTTLAAIVILQAMGYDVLLPFGENLRYDLVIDAGGNLTRVQCKTGRLRKGAVRFNVCSTYGHHRSAAQSRRSYRDEIDSFAVYCPETGALYVVPIADVDTDTEASLRVDPARNGQENGIRSAERYFVGSVAVTTRARGPA